MYDASRRVFITLDVASRVIWYKDAGSVRRKLYDIVETSADTAAPPRPPVKAWARGGPNFFIFFRDHASALRYQLPAKKEKKRCAALTGPGLRVWANGCAAPDSPIRTSRLHANTRRLP